MGALLGVLLLGATAAPAQIPSDTGAPDPTMGGQHPNAPALPPGPGPGPASPPAEGEPLLQLGPGDEVNLQVYGQPDMSTSTYISDAGEVGVALAGPVHVAGLSPSQAAQRVEAALRDGGFLVNPHVTITVVQTRSQRVSVIGEVKVPGRFPIDASTTVLDLLAAAGGTTPGASDTVYIFRPDANGTLVRIPVELRGFKDAIAPVSAIRLKGGDSIMVPAAAQIQIYGEVHVPNTFRYEPGMRVFEAIAKAGGVTDKGSTHRVEIKRKRPDGTFATLGARLDDKLEPGDVIRVKESIF